MAVEMLNYADEEQIPITFIEDLPEVIRIAIVDQQPADKKSGQNEDRRRP
jgi:hypothetical protein